MTPAVAVTFALGLATLLVWAGMTGRLEPDSRALRQTLNIALGLAGMVAGVVALAWFALLSSLTF